MMTYFLLGCILAIVYLFGAAIHLVDLEADEFCYGPGDILACFVAIPIFIILFYPVITIGMFFLLILVLGKKG